MAFEKKDSTNLEHLAKNMSVTGGIQRPGDTNNKKEEEIQYSTMDLIAGLCSSAMFIGGSNKNKNNIQALLSNTKKSYLFSINDHLNNIKKYLKFKNESNLQSDVKDAISSSLENLIKGNAAINVKLITDANKDSSTGTNEAVKILIDIKNADSLAKLIEELSYANEFGQFDKLINSFGWLNQILEKISNLNVDSVNLTNNIESFKVLLEYFDEHKNITVPDFSSFAKAIDQTALNGFINMIDQLSGLSGKLTKENVESVNDIFVLLNNLNRSLPNEKESKDITDNIKKLTNIFKDNQGGLTALYNAIQSVFKDSSLTIENVKGLNEVLNSVITIVSFDKDINTDVIYELEQLLTDGGVVRNIIKDINAISGEITGNSAKSLSILNSYIASLTAIGDIGLISKINMMINFEFFKFYVNKKLPSLIKDINDNFKDLSSPQNLEVLESLEDYFSYIKNIGFVSVKDMIKMTLNIEFLRHFALKEIKKLIDEISTEFGKIDDSKSSLSNISKLFANLMSITNIDASKIDDQRKNLSNIRKLIFGETIFGKRLGFLSNLRYSSISQIIEMINNFGKDLGDTTNNVNNIKKIMLLLNKNIISLKLDEKGAKTNIKILTLVHKKELPALEKSIKYIKKIGEDYNDLDLTDFVNVLEKIKNATDKNSVKEIFDKLFVDKDATKRILNTYAAFSNLKLLTKTLVWFGKIDESVIEKSLKPLTKLAEGLNIVINKFNFDEKKLKTAIKVLKELELFLLKTSLILILSVFALSFFTLEDVSKYVLGISVLLGGVYIILGLLSSKEFNDIENKLKIIQQISKMLAILSLSFAISLKIMQGVDLETFLILGASIIGSLVICGGIVILVNIFKKSIDTSIPIAKDLAILMFTLSISLALGAFIAQAVSLEHIKTFGGLLGVLIIALAAPLFVLSKGSSVLFQGGKDLGILILMVSASLALGSFIAQVIPVEDIAKFGVILAGLIVSLAVPLLVVSIFGKAMIQGGKDLGLIMMYTTLSLLIGGLFIMLGGEKLVNAIDEFKRTLLSFVSVLLIAYGFASLLGKSGMEHAKTLNKIILISALSLLIGGALFMIDGFKEAVNDFALTLWLFITGVSLALGIAAYFAQDGLKYAWQIALIVAVTSLAMTLGPLLLKKYGVDYSDVFCFLLNSVAFIAAIGALAYFAEKFKSKIGIGLIIVGAAGLIIYGMAWLFSYIKANFDSDDRKQLFFTVMAMFGTMTLIITFTGIIGAIGLLVWPALVAGAVIIVICGVLIWGMAELYKRILDIDGIYKFSNIKVDKDGKISGETTLIKAIDGMFGVIQHIMNKIRGLDLTGAGPNASILNKLKGAVKGGLKTGALAAILLVVNEIAGTMYVLGRVMNSLGDNPVQLMNSAKTTINSMFDIWADKDLQSKLTVVADNRKLFEKTSKALNKMGKAISSIAIGVQQYASLSIPSEFDSNGNPISYRQLIDDDFTNASKNIALVITTVGGAIMGLFTGKDANGNDLNLTETQLEVVKEMMKTSGGVVSFFTGKTRFAQIIDATKGLGEVISSIAAGVLLYAAMQIPDQWDEKGNPTHFKDINKNEVFTEAAENISEIISLIGSTLLTTANDHPELFEDGLLTDSPITIATNAATKMGAIVAGLSEGIQSYANLRIPDKWDDNGKPIHWLDVKDKNTYFAEASSNIGQIVTTIGNTLLSLSENDKRGIFDIGSGSAVTRVTDAIVKVSGIIGKIADQIGHYATGQYPKLEWVSGKLTTKDYYHLSTDQIKNARTAITEALTCIAGALFDTVNNNKNLKKIIEGKKVDEFSKGIETMVNSITKIANSVNSLIKLQLTTERFKPLLDVIQLYLNEIVLLHYYGTTYELTKDLKNTLFGYEEYIREWIKIGQNASETGQEGYNILNTSIDNINKAIANINNTDVFKQHVATVKDYVTTINSIDVSKVQSFVSLIDSINSLGDKMENLDSFTTALADKLTIVFKNLADKLDEAKKSIKDADALHSKREKLIKGSVNTIKELMKQEMIVKIEQEDKPSPGGGTPGGNPGSGGSKSPSGGANVTAEGGNDTTVNNTSINKGNSGGGNNNSSSVDIDALASAIANKMAAVLDARNIGS